MTNLITAATSVSETTTRTPVCSFILLYDRISVGPTKSCLNLWELSCNFIYSMCLQLQSRYVFRCFTGSQSLAPKTINSGRKSGSWVQSCNLDSHFSFSHFQMNAVMKGQCLTEHIFLQINAACKIKADNHSTRETRSWSMTIHISRQASVMTCDVIRDRVAGVEVCMTITAG